MSSSQSHAALTILGSGTCVPSLSRSSCSALAEIGSEKILFDCGPGTMRRLLEAGTTIFEISLICLSHFHLDHSGELASFLFSSKYQCGGKRDTPLCIMGGSGLSAFLDGLKRVYGEWVSLDTGLDIMEMAGDGKEEKNFGDFSVQTLPVNHNPESVAFRLNIGGRSLVYSGDTDYSENLIKLARDADLLILESALPDARKVQGHLTPPLAGKMATEAGAQMLVLTHFYPECDEADIRGECRTMYDGPLLLAKDLMRIDL
ncbi:MAG: MBL fold metallo-hydrolase [Desulfobacterales bacterium]|nr:MAG: MBL fold metallo-hydrolase [Desulfobacterales bacterium]